MAPQFLGREPQGFQAPGRRRQLGIVWRYPTYREGLRAIFAREGDRASRCGQGDA